ncbi:MAG: HEPN domain-containing protein [Armatimonadetes bacterium]|nr:HEPN domain-containing protein [Armatimonadota bacterium]
MIPGEAGDSRPEWPAWVEQAQHDLAGARSNAANGFWDVAVVLAQQAAEKMVKAVWIHRTGREPPRTHAVDNLLRRLDAPVELVPVGLRLARGSSPYGTPACTRRLRSSPSRRATPTRLWLTQRGSSDGRRHTCLRDERRARRR